MKIKRNRQCNFTRLHNSDVARIPKMLGHKFVDASAHRAEATREVWGHAPPEKFCIFEPLRLLLGLF